MAIKKIWTNEKKKKKWENYIIIYEKRRTGRGADTNKTLVNVQNKTLESKTTPTVVKNESTHISTAHWRSCII